MKYGRKPQYLWNWKMTSIFSNGRQPKFCSRQHKKLIFGMQSFLTQLDWIWKTTSIFLKMEEDLFFPRNLQSQYNINTSNQHSTPSSALTQFGLQLEITHMRLRKLLCKQSSFQDATWHAGFPNIGLVTPVDPAPCLIAIWMVPPLAPCNTSSCIVRTLFQHV